MTPSRKSTSTARLCYLHREVTQTPKILPSCGLAFHWARVAPSWSLALFVYFILHFVDPLGNNELRAKL